LSLLIALGSAGSGLVWGWLVASAGALGRDGRSVVLAVSASLVVAAQVAGLAGWGSAPVLGAGMVVSVAVHAGWRRFLGSRAAARASA
jgi:hypothetical protein